jgi:hypothetical protein
MLGLYLEMGHNNICNVKIHLINVIFSQNIAKGCLEADTTVQVLPVGFNNVIKTGIIIYTHGNKTRYTCGKLKVITW